MNINHEAKAIKKPYKNGHIHNTFLCQSQHTKHPTKTQQENSSSPSVHEFERRSPHEAASSSILQGRNPQVLTTTKRILLDAFPHDSFSSSLTFCRLLGSIFTCFAYLKKKFQEISPKSNPLFQIFQQKFSCRTPPLPIQFIFKL